MARPAGLGPPKVLDVHIRFELADPDAAYSAVRLRCDRAIPVPDANFRRTGDRWVLEIPRPTVVRMEYQLTVTDDGDTYDILDPANPVTVETAFGSKSVLELPGYAPPWWLAAEGTEGELEPVAVAGETEDDVPVSVWSPTGTVATDPLPLLLVHDGPEYDELASLTRYSGALVHAGTLPPHRVALAQPVRRDDWYSASPRYLRTVLGAGLTTLTDLYAVSGPVVVMGASLGGLTALLAGIWGAPRVGGVFSQSGSFFRVVRDHHTVADYRYYDRIVSRVEAIRDMTHTDHPLRIGMTCGATEENASNNRDMAAALRRTGHRVTYAEVPDLHNYTAWRDALDPHLTEVLRDCWGATG